MESTQLENLISDFINRRVWVVVGASQDETKYGNRIFRSLLASGYRVYPVNPRGGEIEGQTVYSSLAELPEPPEVVDIVVPPAAAEEVVKEAHARGLTRVWLQPGAESEAAITWGEEHGMEVVHDACAMKLRREWNDPR